MNKRGFAVWPETKKGKIKSDKPLKSPWMIGVFPFRYEGERYVALSPTEWRGWYVVTRDHWLHGSGSGPYWQTEWAKVFNKCGNHDRWDASAFFQILDQMLSETSEDAGTHEMAAALFYEQGIHLFSFTGKSLLKKEDV